MRRSGGCFGCLIKLMLLPIIGLAIAYAVLVALNPWALHIGGRLTPLLYWHGSGTLHSQDGKTYLLYVRFSPTRSGGAHGGGRREGKIVGARLNGSGWLCVAPGQIQRLTLSGTMYGGYTSSDGSLFDFRLLSWKQPFAFFSTQQHRGYFDLAGTFQGSQLVMDRPGQQGARFDSGVFIDHATAALDWTTYDQFEAACSSMSPAVQ